MTTSYTPTALETAAAAPLPGADAVADEFVRQQHPNPATPEERKEKMDKLLFGKDYSDFQAHATWTAEEGWHNKVIEPYGALSLDPATSVLHYGQEIFEGLKAYRHEDGSIWTFRPSYNAARLNYSADRLAIPHLSHEDFVASLVGLVRADSEWVPSVPGSSFYLRPFTFASEAFLGVRAAAQYEYMVIGSPSGPYFEHGFQPINVWVEREYHRAGPGGMGDAKTGGNYASSLLPKVKAHGAGFDEVLFLDAATDTNLDELGGMNVFVVMADGSFKTPKLTGNILPGVTRDSLLTVAPDLGLKPIERPISLEEVTTGITTGAIRELFACGTAAVITPIRSLKNESGEYVIDVDKATHTIPLRNHLLDIQYGRIADSHGWMQQVC